MSDLTHQGCGNDNENNNQCDCRCRMETLEEVGEMTPELEEMFEKQRKALEEGYVFTWGDEDLTNTKS